MDIKFLKIKKTFRKGGLHINPDVFWNILQGTAFVLVISSFIFGFYLFYKIEKGFVLPTQSTDNKTQSIDMERINKILELFSQKKEKSTKITNSPSPIVDPSI